MERCNIAELEEQLRKAMLTSDVDALDELISDSLFFTAPTGDVISKQMDIEMHRSGVQKLTKLETLEQHIRFYKGFAVVAAKMQIEGVYGSEKIRGVFAYTRVWAVSDNGKCQIAAGHVSQISG